MPGTHPVRRSGRGRGAAGPRSGVGDQPPPDQGQPCGGADRQCGGMCASVVHVGTPLTRARAVTNRLSPSPSSPMPVIRTRMRSRWEGFAPTTGLCSDELRSRRTQKRSNSTRHHARRIMTRRSLDLSMGVVNGTFLSSAAVLARAAPRFDNSKKSQRVSESASEGARAGARAAPLLITARRVGEGGEGARAAKKRRRRRRRVGG